MTDKFNRIAPFLQLLLRTPDTGDGWRKVSSMLSSVATDEIAKAPELFETQHTEGEDGFLVRLTPEGQIVSRYL
jgi:hypothetical protein